MLARKCKHSECVSGCFVLTLFSHATPAFIRIRRSAGYRERLVGGFDVSYCTDARLYASFGARNNTSVAQLLAEFFHFYAYEFDYHDSVVSVRTGQFLSKTDKGWAGSQRRAEDDDDASGGKEASAAPTAASASAETSASTSAVASINSDASGHLATENDSAAAAATAATSARKPPPERTLFCIEDPFEVTHNLGRMVGKQARWGVGSRMRQW